MEHKEFIRPRYKDEIEDIYASILAPFAVQKAKLHSRDYEEEKREKENRSDFQRDRDRIIHSKAFRRLMYKTQVFVNHEGDHFRTRLTHTLEVAQLARGICKSLGLNEDLAEAIALGHDLGHTPFGHAVEEFLSERLQEENIGQFWHNEQSVRVVDFLEHRCSQYQGLNLTFEVREGILKHNTDRSGIYRNFEPDLPCFSLEGQVVHLVDTIAYICHDLQDGIDSGLVTNARKKSKDADLDFQKVMEIINELIPSDGNKMTRANFEETAFIDDLIHQLVMSVVEQSAENLTHYRVKTLADVQKLARDQVVLIGLESKRDAPLFYDLKKLIYRSVYGLNTIQMMDMKAKKVASDLYDILMENPALLPPEEYYKYEHVGQPKGYTGLTNSKVQVICDYIASMTDRFALEEHERFTNPRIKI